MKQINVMRKLAMALPETTEEPHFEKTSFRVKGKIFATYDEKRNRACVKFSGDAQVYFSTIDTTAIFPVPNKWGEQGWTFIQLDMLNDEILKNALITAYRRVAPKKIARNIKPGAV